MQIFVLVIQQSVFRIGEIMLLLVSLLVLHEGTTQSNLSLNQIRADVMTILYSAVLQGDQLVDQ